jgi:hypothetical protein
MNRRRTKLRFERNNDNAIIAAQVSEVPARREAAEAWANQRLAERLVPSQGTTPVPHPALTFIHAESVLSVVCRGACPAVNPSIPAQMHDEALQAAVEAYNVHRFQA